MRIPAPLARRVVPELSSQKFFFQRVALGRDGRIADISPGLMDDLGIETDDEVEVVFPYKKA